MHYFWTAPRIFTEFKLFRIFAPTFSETSRRSISELTFFYSDTDTVLLCIILNVFYIYIYILVCIFGAIKLCKIFKK